MDLHGGRRLRTFLAILWSLVAIALLVVLTELAALLWTVQLVRIPVPGPR